jgi:hypothetical protein
MVPTRARSWNGSGACNQFCTSNTVICPAGASKSKLLLIGCVVIGTHILLSLHGRNALAVSGMAQPTPVVLK